MHKRKKFRLFPIFLFLVLAVINVTSCDKSIIKEEYNLPKYDGFSVHFIDVGEGNAIFIQFDDGKTALIDCGSVVKEKAVLSALKSYNVEKIDYLILTHPDSEHIGGAKSVLRSKSIGTAYLPKIKNREAFGEFNEVYNLLTEKGTEIKVSKAYEYILGENYSFAFLSPSFNEKEYDDLNESVTPTSDVIENISPIIYLEYLGVRFVISSDAEVSEEREMLVNYKGAYKKIYQELGVKIDVENVDFYFMANHGSSKSNDRELLDYLSPKNAIISVGGSNREGNPSVYVLKNLLLVNENMEIFRTDVSGTISVLCNKEGKYKVQTEG